MLKVPLNPNQPKRYNCCPAKSPFVLNALLKMGNNNRITTIYWASSVAGQCRS